MSRRPEPPPGAEIARQVRSKGIKNLNVLKAIAQFDRERFVPPEHRDLATEDRAVPIGLEQTISQPFIVAFMTQELDLSGRERVLEIGTGSGYQTAILSVLAKEVFTVERIRLLSLRARGILDGHGITNVRFKVGDGSLGWPEEAPFDRILVTAGAPALPPHLLDQLGQAGVLVAPIGAEESQQVTVVQRRAGQDEIKEVLPCRFVKLIGEEGWSGDQAAEEE